MPGRYKNSHINIGQGPTHTTPAGTRSNLRQMYQSEAPPPQVSEQSIVIYENSPRVSVEEVEVGKGYRSPRSLRSSTRTLSRSRRGSGMGSKISRGAKRMGRNVKRSAQYATGRRGGSVIDRAYRCLKLLFIIDVAVFLFTAILGILPWIFGWAIGWAFTYFLPLLPGLVMEVISLIKGMNDYNFNFIDCTLKVRTIGNAIMLFIGVILLIIGLILLATGHSLTWSTDGGWSKYYGSAIFYTGLAWFFAGIYAGITLWFMRREWKKIKGI